MLLVRTERQWICSVILNRRVLRQRHLDLEEGELKSKLNVPQQFCWTRFGTESGQTPESIFARKDAERQSCNGVFLWGIGNSVRAGITELVKIERSPKVVFSPMLSRPSMADSRPESVVRWDRARTLNGDEWALPGGAVVLSRAGAPSGPKRQHYALVCHSDGPISPDRDADAASRIAMSDLVNLTTGNPLGHSQVTAVVSRKHPTPTSHRQYRVAAVAELVYPYFVVLSEPRAWESHLP